MERQLISTNGTEVGHLFTQLKESMRTEIPGKYQYILAADSLSLSKKVLNVVPGDYNHDGRLDLLVMTEERNGGWWGGEKVKVEMQVHLGAETGGFGQ